MPRGVYKRTKYVWNKGLTKETDSRVLENSKKVSISLMGKKCNNGFKVNSIPWNKNKKSIKISEGLRGKKLTPEHIENLRKSHKGQIPSPKSGIRNCRRYYHFSPLQGIVCFRSSYEYKYALYLEYNHIQYVYEEFNFDLGYTTYLPDFFLIKAEKFIDTKGRFKKESELKIDKFREEYPWDLEVLFSKDLQDLGINMKIDISEINYEEVLLNKDLTKINTEKIIIKR